MKLSNLLASGALALTFAAPAMAQPSNSLANTSNKQWASFYYDVNANTGETYETRFGNTYADWGKCDRASKLAANLPPGFPLSPSDTVLFVCAKGHTVIIDGQPTE